MLKHVILIHSNITLFACFADIFGQATLSDLTNINLHTEWHPGHDTTHDATQLICYHEAFYEVITLQNVVSIGNIVRLRLDDFRKAEKKTPSIYVFTLKFIVLPLCETVL